MSSSPSSAPVTLKLGLTLSSFSSPYACQILARSYQTLTLPAQYWLAIYACILLIEHFVFRRGSWLAYNPEDYNSPSHLPLGIAAGVSAAVGVVGAVLGMAAQWYVGVIGRKSESRLVIVYEMRH